MIDNPLAKGLKSNSSTRFPHIDGETKAQRRSRIAEESNARMWVHEDPECRRRDIQWVVDHGELKLAWR